MRERFVLTDHPWRFQLDVSDIGEQERWFGDSVDRHTWSRITLPQAWDDLAKPLFGFETVGWFSLDLPGEIFRDPRHLILSFERVMVHAKVWLNGRMLGENTNGYLPFAFDVTDVFRPGELNTLVVRVDNRYRGKWLPFGTRVEWVQYGGILAPVHIESRDMVHLTGISIQTQREGGQTKILAELVVRNVSAEDFSGAVGLLVEAEPDWARRCDVVCAAGAAQRISFEIPCQCPRLWSPDTPHLYDLALELCDSDGRRLDGMQERFGIRTVATRGAEILLNGEPIRIRGVNRYDFFGDEGAAPCPEAVLRDVQMMKEAGVNLVRVHYPCAPQFISLLDEHGIMLMEEIPLNWWGQYFNAWKSTNPDGVTQSEEVVGPCIDALERMIARDGNHPSIIAWSMGNENKGSTEVGIRVMRKLIATTRQLDATRLVTYVVGGGTKNDRACEDVDIVCTNMYYGLHSGKIVAHHLCEMDEVVYGPSLDNLRKHVALWPAKPVLVTEFGMFAVKGIHGDINGSEAFQAAVIEAVWRAIEQAEGVAGGVLWCWSDYPHHRNITESPYGQYGVVTVDREPKLAFETLRRLYTSGKDKQ